MINLLLKLMSHPLGVALLLLPLAIIAKNLIGAGGALLQPDAFKPEYLKRGLFKGLLIYAGIGVLALMATIAKELSVNIGGNDYNLIQAVIVLVMGAVALYIRDTFQLLSTIFKQQTVDAIETDFRIKGDHSNE